MIDRRVLRASLQSPQAVWELRGVMRALLSLDYDRDGLVADLATFKEELRSEGRDLDIETIDDVILDLTGYCSPHMLL
ncbi:MAG TPA: hypothetical protein VH482_16935 [Thermomicrobiales bacterium]